MRTLKAFKLLAEQTVTNGVVWHDRKEELNHCDGILGSAFGLAAQIRHSRKKELYCCAGRDQPALHLSTSLFSLESKRCFQVLPNGFDTPPAGGPDYSSNIQILPLPQNWSFRSRRLRVLEVVHHSLIGPQTDQDPFKLWNSKNHLICPPKSLGNQKFWSRTQQRERTELTFMPKNNKEN